MRVLDTAAVREWADACVLRLGALRADIDEINVYPVADSDTGSNLLHTVSAARAALAARDDVGHAGEALSVLAAAAVRAAKGNSGIILSQVLRGLADSAGRASELDGAALAAALCRADAVATRAVARPVAGTVLSVLHATATAVGDTAGPDSTGARARSARTEADAGEVARVAAKAAADALARTPDQLAALAAAGVVDAGGRGLLAVLDALVGVLTGEEPAAPHARPAEPGAPRAPRAWEVMYLLALPGTETRAAGSDGLGPGVPPWRNGGAAGGAKGGADPDDSVPPLPELRRALSALGDSVTVAEAGDGEYAVHVHCADIGAALEAGLRHGRPHQVRVEPLVTPAPADSAATREDRAVVAVVHGEAFAELVVSEGAAALPVPAGGEPSAEQLLSLITESGATHVTVLPGDVRLTAVAERVAAHPVLAGRDVVVVPCASPVQVLAALAVHDPERRAGADVVAMAEAAAATRRGELVVAREAAITWLGRVAAGEPVGLIDGEVVCIGAGRDLARVATDVLDRMLAVGGELVTVLVGADAPDELGETLAAHVRAERPDVELVCYPGGQTDALLLMGVE